MIQFFLLGLGTFLFLADFDLSFREKPLIDPVLLYKNDLGAGN